MNLLKKGTDHSVHGHRARWDERLRGGDRAVSPLFQLPLLFLFCSIATYGAGLVDNVKDSLAHGDVPRAAEMVRAYRASRGVTPEAVEALSWIARTEFTQKNLVQADKQAREVYKLALDELKTRSLAREPHLQIALGAAIEVEAEILTVRGQRAEAVTYLHGQLKAYYATPLRPRIQKNINLLSLEGKRAPALDGVAMPSGKPALLFFWAHWCGDCKYEGPILARIESEFSGLAIVAPTQHYGYIGSGEDAPPEVESRYIGLVWRKFYPALAGAPSPISEENFNKYGASTVPTLVLIDRAGIVRLYHPGVLRYDELRPRVANLFR